jgi:hypothetical protein
MIFIISGAVLAYALIGGVAYLVADELDVPDPDLIGLGWPIVVAFFLAAAVVGLSVCAVEGPIRLVARRVVWAIQSRRDRGVLPEARIHRAREVTDEAARRALTEEE